MQSPRAKKRRHSPLSMTSLLNQAFHVAQIIFERAAAGRAQFVFGFRNTALKKLCTNNVSRILELARMDAQIAIGGTHQSFEIIKCKAVVSGESADDTESQSFVNQPIKLRR